MPIVVPIKFPFASKDLWFGPDGLDIAEADYAVVCTERGTEIGLVTGDPFEVSDDQLQAPLKPVIRIADDADMDRADELAHKGDEAMSEYRSLVKDSGLDMKPVGVEYLFDGEKAVFYFAAEERVDFRQLVRDLANAFHVRVDMRQIGVRDETRLTGGFATCGQELCCTRFGGQFEPVSIRMAKEQDLPLNSAKISGVCGRLMCCLRYEFEAYKDFKGRAPKKKTLIDTPLGKARIQEYDTPREQLTLRLESGKMFKVSLSDMTCSDACVKRAEEQGCTCRPDCVTRDIMERIESPEIKLALLELDRQNGVDVGDGLDSADRLVEPPTPTEGHRRREHEESTSHARSDDAQPRRRRRHVVAGSAPEAREENPAPSRASAGASEGGSAKRTSRRCHHSAVSQKPNVPSVAQQLQEGEVKVTRRHPGDGGGTLASGRAANSNQPDTSKKRRRRRSRKPKQDGGGEGTAPTDK